MSSTDEDDESLSEDSAVADFPAVAMFWALYGGGPSMIVGRWIVICLAGGAASMSTANFMALLLRVSKLSHRAGTSPQEKFQEPDGSVFALASDVCLQAMITMHFATKERRSSCAL